jgi:hypothetical protein
LSELGLYDLRRDLNDTDSRNRKVIEEVRIGIANTEQRIIRDI